MLVATGTETEACVPEDGEQLLGVENDVDLLLLLELVVLFELEDPFPVPLFVLLQFRTEEVLLLALTAIGLTTTF